MDMKSATLGLFRTLNAAFKAQAAHAANDPEHDLDPVVWTKVVAQAAEPFLLRLTQFGLLRSAHRTDRKYTGVRRHSAPEAFKSSRFVYKSLNVGVEYDLTSAKLRQQVTEYSLFLAKSTLDTARVEADEAREKAKRAIALGVSRDETLAALTKRLRKIFGDPSRAKRIAATESVRATNAGTIFAAKESGVVTAKEWVTSPGSCPQCQELDGKEVGLEEPFVVLPGGGPYATVMFPPLHPYCTCAVNEVL